MRELDVTNYWLRRATKFSDVDRQTNFALQLITDRTTLSSAKHILRKHIQNAINQIDEEIEVQSEVLKTMMLEEERLV